MKLIQAKQKEVTLANLSINSSDNLTQVFNCFSYWDTLRFLKWDIEKWSTSLSFDYITKNPYNKNWITSKTNNKILKIEFICWEVEADSMKEFEAFLKKEWNINSLQQITSEGWNFNQEKEKLLKSQSDFSILNPSNMLDDCITLDKSENT